MSRFTLPYPPSANRLWRYVGNRPIKSAEYRSWLFLAVQTIILQKPAKVPGRFIITALVSPPDRRLRDLDNLSKATLDAIAAAGLIDNDCLARRITFEWLDEIVRDGIVNVRLEPFTPEAIQQAA